MTYQRNMCRRLEVEEDVFDKTGEREVGDPEIHPDDGDRNDDDQGRRGNLLAIRPLDLLELADRLRCEAAKAAATLTASTRLALRLANGLDLAPSLARALARSPSRLLEIGALAACAGLASHYLSGFPMERLRPAPAAELLGLETVRRVSLRLLRLVIPALALGARERDRNSYSCSHVSSFFSLRDL